MLERGGALQFGQEPSEKIELRNGREGDENLGLDRGDERRERRRFEQRIEHGDNSGCFAAPKRKMAFGQVRQDDCDNVILANAERVERIRHLPHARNELAVSPALGVGKSIGRQKKRNRRLVRPDLCAATDQVVSAFGKRIERAGGLDFYNLSEIGDRLHLPSPVTTLR